MSWNYFLRWKGGAHAGVWVEVMSKEWMEGEGLPFYPYRLRFEGTYDLRQFVRDAPASADDPAAKEWGFYVAKEINDCVYLQPVREDLRGTILEPVEKPKLPKS